MSAIYRSREFIGKMSFTKAELEKMRQAQFEAYDALKERKKKSVIQGKIGSFSASIINLLFRNKISAVVNAVYQASSVISGYERGIRRDSIYLGLRDLEDIKKIWPSSATAIEINIGFLEDEMMNKEKVRYPVGGYKVLRIRTKGGWENM